MSCRLDKPGDSDTDVQIKDTTHASTSAAGSQSMTNITRTVGVKRKRTEANQMAVEIIEISLDEDEPVNKKRLTDIVDLNVLVKILTKETGKAKRAQEKAERCAEHYHKSLQAMGDVVKAKEEADQLVVKYERENKECKDQLQELKATFNSMEQDAECEICKLPLWYPYLLPDCGHIFCEKCIHDWLEAIMKKHREQTNPGFLWSRPILVPLEVVRGIAWPSVEYHVVLTLFNKIRKAMKGPAFSCPLCRKEVRNRPVQAFTMKSITQKLASTRGETMPVIEIPKLGGRYSHWDEFFPFHYITNRDITQWTDYISVNLQFEINEDKWQIAKA
ncbi:hypothetical protein IW261DRAFT_1412785 [Armillaria novae-zelandiae]|uniref:RING-type domain-containing protein n=1 Tax=Armillaria novae-zelandiae TaxID=153914 RepID=A0AA39PTE0_9AGAR|nr:hypothetical protein IW261DRAFT_1412785 [Armillaria novae-zelandiae]